MPLCYARTKSETWKVSTDSLRVALTLVSIWQLQVEETESRKLSPCNTFRSGGKKLTRSARCGRLPVSHSSCCDVESLEFASPAKNATSRCAAALARYQ